MRYARTSYTPSVSSMQNNEKLVLSKINIIVTELLETSVYKPH